MLAKGLRRRAATEAFQLAEEVRRSPLDAFSVYCVALRERLLLPGEEGFLGLVGRINSLGVCFWGRYDSLQAPYKSK